MNRRVSVIFILVNIIISSVFANNLEDAKLLYLNAQYSKALPLFKTEFKRKPKDAALNHWIGVCLYECDSIKEARKYLEYANQKGILEAPHYLAKISADEYDFDAANDYMKHYETLLVKGKKEISTEVESEIAEVKNAKSMLSHVEKIVIIDSILVDKDTFFKAYKLSKDAGTFTEIQTPNNESVVAFMPQSGERLLWGETDSLGRSVLMEKTKLIDGSWEYPQSLSEGINKNGNSKFPFLMPDGATLYYASDGEGSIGGYDIFFTRKDVDSGDYLKPQNLGMPYNSPYDDYLYVLDEVAGFGWWATDRNRIPGKITIYVFIPNEIRQNYDSQDENIKNYARVANYKSTWNGEDFSEYIEKFGQIGAKEKKNKEDFIFAVSSGVIYKSYKDFKSSEAKALMKDLVLLKNEINNLLIENKENRGEYAKSKGQEKLDLKNIILQKEKKIEVLRQDIFIKENNIRKIENRSK